MYYCDEDKTNIDNTGTIIDVFCDPSGNNIVEDNDFLIIEENIKDEYWCFQENIIINDKDIEIILIYNDDGIMFILFADISSLKKEKIVQGNNNGKQ